jgi:hypothetical protein
MSADLLNELMTKYGTDKNIWGYHPYYAEALEHRRHQVKKVLEIGICGHRDIPNNVVGASLFVWKDYFPNATIYGVDNDARFIFNDQARIHTALCDAYDTMAMDQVMVDWVRDAHDGFDVIIDDAVHDPGPQIALMNHLGRYLRPGGLYFVEEACPYKMPMPTSIYFSQHVRGFKAVTSCVTPKPEELLIGIK